MKITNVINFILVVIVIALYTFAAQAADVVINAPAPAGDVAPTVSVPWGSWVQMTINAISEVLYSVVIPTVATAVVSMVPIYLKPFVSQQRVEQALRRATEAAIAKTKGAVEGEEANIEITNRTIREAVQFGIDNLPKWLFKYIGTNGTMWVDKVLARLEERGVVPKGYDANSPVNKKVVEEIDDVVRRHLGGK